MLSRLKLLVRRYDKWCEELGLTPENKRSCVPHRTDPINADDETTNTKAEQPNGKHHD